MQVCTKKDKLVNIRLLYEIDLLLVGSSGRTVLGRPVSVLAKNQGKNDKGAHKNVGAEHKAVLFYSHFFLYA